MNTFKRKSLNSAVLVALGVMGVAGTASAVHVNPDGLGQVLIYPYYTVRSAATAVAAGQFNTYISVTNTTASAKAVKVRFIEGKGSKEVLDFNLFLSPYDTWTGAVLPNSATASAGAKVVTNDKSCTWGTVTSAGIPFSNLAYSNGAAGNNADWNDASLDRTNEGYVEIMEMGVITQTALRTAVTHVNGVAPCTASVLSAADSAGLVGYLTAPVGGLLGGASLVNPLTGVDYAFDAVALDNWDNTATGLGSQSTSLTPSIISGSVRTSDVFMGATSQNATWLTGRDAVSAAIMRNQVMNEYVMDTATASLTDWIVTFPTKRFYVATEATAAAKTNAVAPTAGNRLFNSNFGTGGSCDAVTYTIRDREEQVQTPTSSGFSPAVGPSTNTLCWEANVITFGYSASAPSASAILGSTNGAYVQVPSGWQNGWMNLAFAATATTPSLTPAASLPVAGVMYRGLPVVGLMVQDFVNSTIVTGSGATPGAAFGGEFGHKYTRDIR